MSSNCLAIGLSVLEAPNARFIRCMRRIASGLRVLFFFDAVFLWVVEVEVFLVVCVVLDELPEDELPDEVCADAEKQKHNKERNSKTDRILTT